MRVQKSRTTPPGNWQWRAPDGQLIVSPTFGSFETKVRAWYAANGLVYDPEAFEDALCRNLGIEDTHCGQPKKLRPNTPGTPTLGDLKAFLRLLKEMFNASPDERIVDTAEAARRAAICRCCPMNRKVDGCMGCSKVGDLVKGIIGGATTVHDDALETCSICHCYLRAKVFVNRDLLLKVEEGMDRLYPEHCWMKEA